MNLAGFCKCLRIKKTVFFLNISLCASMVKAIPFYMEDMFNHPVFSAKWYQEKPEFKPSLHRLINPPVLLSPLGSLDDGLLLSLAFDRLKELYPNLAFVLEALSGQLNDQQRLRTISFYMKNRSVANVLNEALIVDFNNDIQTEFVIWITNFQQERLSKWLAESEDTAYLLDVLHTLYQLGDMGEALAELPLTHVLTVLNNSQLLNAMQNIDETIQPDIQDWKKAVQVLNDMLEEYGDLSDGLTVEAIMKMLIVFSQQQSGSFQHQHNTEFPQLIVMLNSIHWEPYFDAFNFEGAPQVLLHLMLHHQSLLSLFSHHPEQNLHEVDAMNFALEAEQMLPQFYQAIQQQFKRVLTNPGLIEETVINVMSAASLLSVLSPEISAKSVSTMITEVLRNNAHLSLLRGHPAEHYLVELFIELQIPILQLDDLLELGAGILQDFNMIPPDSFDPALFTLSVMAGIIRHKIDVRPFFHKGSQICKYTNLVLLLQEALPSIGLIREEAELLEEYYALALLYLLHSHGRILQLIFAPDQPLNQSPATHILLAYFNSFSKKKTLMASTQRLLLLLIRAPSLLPSIVALGVEREMLRTLLGTLGSVKIKEEQWPVMRNALLPAYIVTLTIEPDAQPVNQHLIDVVQQYFSNTHFSDIDIYEVAIVLTQQNSNLSLCESQEAVHEELEKMVFNVDVTILGQ